MSFFLTLLTLLLPIAYIQLRFAYYRRQLHKRDWQTVLASVKPVDVAGLRTISDNYLNPDREQLHLEPTEMWKMVGGLEGVARLRSNATAMLDLAVYAQQWNRTDGRIVSEMIRRDAVRVKRAVWQIQIAFLFQRRIAHTPFLLQEAVSSYCLMRSRLLGLYDNSHVGLLPLLAEAV